MCLQHVSLGTRLWAQLSTKDKQALNGHPKSSSLLPGASQTLALQPASIADSLIAVAFPRRREGVKPQNGHGHQRECQLSSPASYLVPELHTCPPSLHGSEHETAALVENRPVLRLIQLGQSVGGKRRINWQREQQSVSERQEEG